MPTFISHSFKDEAVYSTLCLALDAAGVTRWDPTSMALGDSLSEQLQRAIHTCEVCIFVATRRSIESPWCLAELGAFWGSGKKVLMFMADPDLADSTLPPQFKGTLRADTAARLMKRSNELPMTIRNKMPSPVAVRRAVSLLRRESMGAKRSGHCYSTRRRSNLTYAALLSAYGGGKRTHSAPVFSQRLHKVAEFGSSSCTRIESSTAWITL